MLKRPGLDKFLQTASKYYELVLFTASMARYADPLVDKLDPHGLIAYRLYRENCTFVGHGFVKDISQLGRNLKDVIILDNAPISYAFQPFNALPSYTWIDDMQDTQLLDIIPLLKLLAGVNDVRECLKQIVRSNQIDYKAAYRLLGSGDSPRTPVGLGRAQENCCTPERKAPLVKKTAAGSEEKNDVKPRIYRAVHKEFEQSPYKFSIANEKELGIRETPKGEKRMASTDGFKRYGRPNLKDKQPPKTVQKEPHSSGAQATPKSHPKAFSEKKPPRYPQKANPVAKKGPVEKEDSVKNGFDIKRKNEATRTYADRYDINEEQNKAVHYRDNVKERENEGTLKKYEVKVLSGYEQPLAGEQMADKAKSRRMNRTFDMQMTSSEFARPSEKYKEAEGLYAKDLINRREMEDLYKSILKKHDTELYGFKSVLKDHPGISRDEEVKNPREDLYRRIEEAYKVRHDHDKVYRKEPGTSDHSRTSLRCREEPSSEHYYNKEYSRGVPEYGKSGSYARYYDIAECVEDSRYRERPVYEDWRKPNYGLKQDSGSSEYNYYNSRYKELEDNDKQRPYNLRGTEDRLASKHFEVPYNPHRENPLFKSVKTFDARRVDAEDYRRSYDLGYSRALGTSAEFEESARHVDERRFERDVRGEEGLRQGLFVERGSVVKREADVYSFANSPNRAEWMRNYL